MDAVFKALGDPSRREILDRLQEHNGQTLGQLCQGLDMVRQSVTKHLDVLEAAGLVASMRRGRERLHYLNVAPINDIAQRWIRRYDQPRVDALHDLKTALEALPMSDTPTSETSFVYKTTIETTPQQLWAALTEPAFTKRYWGLAMESEWTPGAPFVVVLERGGVRIEHPDQVVLEAEPYRRLAYTWHTFTPEWGAAYGFDPEYVATLAAEPRSRVAFDIEQAGPLVQLTVLHEGFEPGSKVLEGISQGWPAIVSSLKTLLETGEPLPAPG